MIILILKLGDSYISITATGDTVKSGGVVQRILNSEFISRSLFVD